MNAKMTAATVDGMSARVYEAAVLPQRIDVGDTKDVVIAVHMQTPNQLGTGNTGDASEQSFNDKYPNIVKIFEFAGGQPQKYQYATVASINDAPVWKYGDTVRNPPAGGYVLFRHDMTPVGKKGHVPKQANSTAAVACYFER